MYPISNITIPVVVLVSYIVVSVSIIVVGIISVVSVVVSERYQRFELICFAYVLIYQNTMFSSSLVYLNCITIPSSEI